MPSTTSTLAPGESMVHRALEFIPALLLCPFIVLFLIVAFGRLSTPFELEWNEGQNAVQAWRFSQGLSLYPDPESGWVPYMYAPLYHQALGALFFVSQQETLSWGRFISLLATVGTLLGLVEFVYNQSKRLSLGVFSAGLYASFFAASGYWYDLARNDSLMGFFTLIGVSLLMRSSEKNNLVGVALFLLCLGTWTKQPVFPLLVVSAAFALWRQAPQAKRAALIAGIGFANLLVLYPAMGNPFFWHYTVSNALSHASDFSGMLPSSGNYAYSQNPLRSGLVFQPAYWEAALKTPPRIWSEILFPALVWLLALGCCSLTAINPFVFGGKTKGCRSAILFGLVIFLWSLWASLGAYTKFGGYNNNWMPFFLTISALLPVACGGLFNHSPRTRVLTSIGLGCCALLHLATQLYNPFQQIPTEADVESYKGLIEELREKAEVGETVWVAHHQWYALKTGHPVLYNWDMVRCATYAGDPVPKAFEEIIKSKTVDWILLNAETLETEWVPLGADRLVYENYTAEGFVEQHRAMIPVAGASQRPTRWYKRKQVE